ncbi:MAG: hypothetical protein E7351_03230 [Clostridiales bacterium]|nr:hypothetical protein [Clostridiales bacterium]
MEEKFEQEVESTASIQTESSVKTEEETRLDSLPRLEDLLKSEKEIKTAPDIKGVTQVEQNVKSEDRVFTQKTDERKVLLKKRLKVVTGVYISVVTLLLAFVLINLFTLFHLKGQIDDNTQTMKNQTERLADLEDTTNLENHTTFEYSLNVPRDYSDDKQEITFLDKITILFRNLLG